MNPGVWRSQRVQVGGGVDRLAAGVDVEDLAAADAVGPVDDDLAVEAPGAQQRGIEDVRPVGGGDQDDVVLHLEAVHLDQQLVQRLLTLVVPAAHAGAAMAADGVDLVHEDDAGRVLLGLLEQVADTARADADEHLDEVRAGDREEGHAGLAGDRAGQQRLAGAGRAEQQHTLGDARAQRLELLGVLEELLDLVQLLDGLVSAGNVLERDLGRVDRHPLGAALAEAHHLAAAALHLVHQEDPEPEEQDEREDVGEHAPPGRSAGRGAETCGVCCSTSVVVTSSSACCEGMPTSSRLLAVGVDRVLDGVRAGEVGLEARDLLIVDLLRRSRTRSPAWRCCPPRGSASARRTRARPR